MKNILLFFLSFALLFCSSKTNFFHYTTSASQKDQFYSHLDLAQFYYDNDDFPKSVEHAEKAYYFDQTSEEASISYSAAYLALAGITPFGLIEKMIIDQKKDDDSASGDNRDDGDDAKPKSEDSFKRIATLLGISENDYLLLGRLDNSDPTLPTIEPACAEEARARLKILTYVNKAIRASCLFVSDKVKLRDEPRHQCGARSHFGVNVNKANMFWGFAHLVEAIIFNQVISYKTTTESKSNLELKVEKVKNFQVGNDTNQLTSFVKAMSDMKRSIDKVMPISGTCSDTDPQTQLVALLNDMAVVSVSIEAISGIPDEIRKSLLDSTASLRELKENTSSLNAGEQASATRKELNKTIADDLLKKINSLNGNLFSMDQRNSICNSYKSISGNTDDIPDICY